MRHLFFASVIVILTSISNHISPVAAQPLSAQAPVETFELTLRVEGVRSAKGQIRAELLGRFGDRAKPRTISYAVQDATVGTNIIHFIGLSAGEYAVQLYHDENANGKVDMNMVGVPTEGYAFSNVPIIQGGIPAFEKMSSKVLADSSANAVMAYAP